MLGTILGTNGTACFPPWIFNVCTILPSSSPMPDLRGDVRAARVQKRTADQDSKRRQGATVAPPPESE